MRCLRCGTNVVSGHSFCKRCRQNLEADPLPKDTVAVILPRPKTEPPKPRPVKTEILLLQAKKKQKILSWVCLILFAVSVVLGALLIYALHPEKRPKGQTYKPVINITEPEGQP